MISQMINHMIHHLKNHVICQVINHVFFFTRGQISNLFITKKLTRLKIFNQQIAIQRTQNRITEGS